MITLCNGHGLAQKHIPKHTELRSLLAYKEKI